MSWIVCGAEVLLDPLESAGPGNWHDVRALRASERVQPAPSSPGQLQRVHASSSASGEELGGPPGGGAPADAAPEDHVGDDRGARTRSGGHNLHDTRGGSGVDDCCRSWDVGDQQTATTPTTVLTYGFVGMATVGS